MFRTTMLTAMVLPALTLGAGLAQASGYGSFKQPRTLPPTPHLPKLQTMPPRQLPLPSGSVGKALKPFGRVHPNVLPVQTPHPQGPIQVNAGQVGNWLPHGNSGGTVAAGHPARPNPVRPLNLSTAAASKGTSKGPAKLALRDGIFGSSDPIVDGVNSVGDLVTNPVSTIGTGIGQILTGGKGFHPDTQDTDWGPPESPSNGQHPGTSQSLHTASQAQAQLWTARTNFISAKHAWESLVQHHASPQQISAAYQKMHASGKTYQQLAQQGNGNNGVQLGTSRPGTPTRLPNNIETISSGLTRLFR